MCNKVHEFHKHNVVTMQNIAYYLLKCKTKLQCFNSEEWLLWRRGKGIRITEEHVRSFGGAYNFLLLDQDNGHTQSSYDENPLGFALIFGILFCELFLTTQKSLKCTAIRRESEDSPPQQSTSQQPKSLMFSYLLLWISLPPASLLKNISLRFLSCFSHVINIFLFNESFSPIAFKKKLLVLLEKIH